MVLSLRERNEAGASSQLHEKLYSSEPDNGHASYQPLFSHNPYLPQQIEWKTVSVGPAPAGMPDSVWASNPFTDERIRPLFAIDAASNLIPYQSESQRAQKPENNEPLYRR